MSQYTIPSVVEKTLHGERAVDIYSRLLSDRIVYIAPRSTMASPTWSSRSCSTWRPTAVRASRKVLVE